MERIFDKNFKKAFMNMQVGEDWNKLKEKYGNISKFQWDKEMDRHFNNLLGKYSNYETRKRSKNKLN